MSNIDFDILKDVSIDDTIKGLCDEVGLTPNEEDFSKIVRLALCMIPITLLLMTDKVAREEGEDDEHLCTRH